MQRIVQIGKLLEDVPLDDITLTKAQIEMLNVERRYWIPWNFRNEDGLRTTQFMPINFMKSWDLNMKNNTRSR